MLTSQNDVVVKVLWPFSYLGPPSGSFCVVHVSASGFWANEAIFQLMMAYNLFFSKWTLQMERNTGSK